MYIVKILNTLVRVPNINQYYNEENLYRISTNFIINLTDLFIKITGETHLQIFPWTRCIPFKKGAKLTGLHGPMYIQLDDYPPYSDTLDR